MNNLVTYNGQTLEFLDLESRLLHLKPRSSVELSDADLVKIREDYPRVFSHMFVHPRRKAVVVKAPKVDPKPVVKAKDSEVKATDKK